MASNSNLNENDVKSENVEHNPSKDIHIKARQSPYGNSSQKRLIVPDDKVDWNIVWKEYNPPFFTHPSVLNNKLPDMPYSSIKTGNMRLKYNAIDGKINRKSFEGVYVVLNDFIPQNPKGRTGIKGRGLLWRWGPNHAADPIVTRWKRNKENNEIITDPITKLPILEFVAIERTDGGGWAIPGGMVDPGENVSTTLKREFGEEALDSYALKNNKIKKEELKKQIDECFKNGIEVFKGYVDDPRNTDNSWMETVAYNFHDEKGDSFGVFQLKAGDDASKVMWMEINKNIKLYASHNWLIKKVVQIRKAHW